MWESPNEKMEEPAAKATFVRTQNVWRISWRRADLEWDACDPVPEVSALPEFRRSWRTIHMPASGGEMPYGRSANPHVRTRVCRRVNQGSVTLAGPRLGNVVLLALTEGAQVIGQAL